MIDIIGLAIAFFTLAGGLIAIYVNMNLKIKELDVKMLGFETRLSDFKEDRTKVAEALQKTNDNVAIALEKTNDKVSEALEKTNKRMAEELEKTNLKIWNKLDSIENKIDMKFEDFAILKAEHERINCVVKNRTGK